MFNKTNTWEVLTLQQLLIKNSRVEPPTLAVSDNATSTVVLSPI